ncbi:MAG: recombinase RecA [Candidatus Bipolaricaulota bacterium]|nr:recombinase RecA [Candidatus Bipolaricaulota bacterium]MDW8151729.1 ATPase domain-containing protein [Candidatus Bipolaricaulota bacterium]
MVERVPSGVPGLDPVLRGGFPKGRTILVLGPAGTGKTLLALQWLLNGAKQGERGLFITLAEPAAEVERNIAPFGWSLKGIEVLDLSPLSASFPRPFEEYTVFPPAEVEAIPVWQRISQALAERKPPRLVLDSVSLLRAMSHDPYQFRRNVLALVGMLNRMNCTALLLAEPHDVEEETALALAVDGVIRLRREIGQSRVLELRYLAVEKLRGSDYLSGLHPFRITSEGIVVFPHVVYALQEAKPGRGLLSSGVPGLDQLLGGGIEVGTATVISGPTGAGKTTVGLCFLATAVAQGRRAAVYTFEEAPESMVARAKALGVLTERHLRGEKLLFRYVNPLTLYPDEFLGLVRQDVEETGCSVVLIDSVRGYTLAMEGFGDLAAHTQNLVAFLQSREVTSFWINEVEYITGDLRLTELGISYLFDNALLMRYAEMGVQVVRLIGCLKKRLGPFQAELREIRFGEKGIWVSEPLTGVTGLLTGHVRPWRPDER